jgi:hypothetical protein
MKDVPTLSGTSKSNRPPAFQGRALMASRRLLLHASGD